MAEIPPLKSPGKIKDFDGTDVALLGGVRRPSGQMTFQDDTANGGAVLTLSQLLSGGGGIAWTDLTDTPGSIVADKLVVANPAGNALEFRAASYSNILATEPQVTGIVNPGDLELSVFSGTQIQVTSGDLGIAVRTTPVNVTEQISTLGIATQITPVNLASRVSFWTASDTLLTGTVAIKEYAAPGPTVADLREEALLGISIHDGGVVLQVINSPDVYRDQGQSVDDLSRRTGGPVIQAGTGVAAEIPATLQIQTTTATVESKGIGFHSSSGVDPNHASLMPAQNPFVFETIEGDGTVFNSAVSTFPKTWNNSGVETALTGQRAVVHQVVWLVNGQGIVQIGTTNYNNYDTAVAAIVQEALQNPLWLPARLLGATIGFVVVSAQATTTWANGSAHLFPVLSGHISVGGVTSFLGLTDTPTTYVERGNVQTINAGADALVSGRINAQLVLTIPDNIASPVTNFGFRAIVHAARFNMTNVFLAVKTADSGAAVTVDVNLAGVTIFPGGKPTLGIGDFESSTVPTTTLAVQGQEFTIDLDATGSVWQDMTVAIQGWIEPE